MRCIRRAAILVFAFSLTLLASCSHAPAKLRLTVLDVGQGDCLLLETPNGRTMLIDGGGSNDDSAVDPRQIGLKTIVPFLHSRGINSLDLVVMTHPHSDHVGGLSEVLREEKVGAVLDGDVLPYPTPSYNACRKAIRDKRIPYRHAIRGTHLDFQDGVTVDVLNPPSPGAAYGTNPNNDAMNNYSVVMRVTYGKTHFLLDGDAETEAESYIIAHEQDLTADVLKCGHHGAGNASSDAWLDRVHPKFAAISCGIRNHFGHPNPGTLARLQAHGVQVFRTDHDGAAIFESDGTTVTAERTIQAHTNREFSVGVEGHPYREMIFRSAVTRVQPCKYYLVQRSLFSIRVKDHSSSTAYSRGSIARC